MSMERAAGQVDQQIDASMRSIDLCKTLLNGGFDRELKRDKFTLVSGFMELRDHFFSGWLIGIKDDGEKAGPVESSDHSSTDTTRAA
jgi:hypothetical protein